MKIVQQIENGPVLICPDIHKDDRGYFYESFNDKEFREKVCNTTFVQDNQSLSSYGVIRGMHFQKGEHAQAKLVRVIKGEVLDVVVDIRPESPNRGKYYAYLLSEDNHYQLFVPRGFAHGFATLKDNTIFQYKCDNAYNKESEGSFNYESFGFKWSLYVPEKNIIVSEKDKNAVPFTNIDGRENLSKVTIEGMVLKLIENSMFAAISHSLPENKDKALFDENIFAEIHKPDGTFRVVKLVGLGPVVYNPESFAPVRNVEVVDTVTGEHSFLTKDFSEVINFYKEK